MGFWDDTWLGRAASSVGNGIAEGAAQVGAQTVGRIPGLDGEWAETRREQQYEAVVAAGDAIVDGAVAVKDGVVAAGTWVADTAAPAVGEGLAYAVAAGPVGYVAQGVEELTGWDGTGLAARNDDVHEFYNYVGENPGRALALGTQGVVNGVTSVGGSLVGLVGDVGRIVVDDIAYTTIRNIGTGIVNLGMEEGNEFAYRERSSFESFGSALRWTTGTTQWLNDHTQIKDGLALIGLEDSAAYYAFERPEMEIVVDASSIVYEEDPDGIYILNENGQYVEAPEGEQGQYSIASFDVIRPHENPRQLFVGADGEVIEGIHAPSDNPETVIVDADGDVIDTAENPRQIAVGPDGEPIEGPNPEQIQGEDGAIIANPDYIPVTMIDNPVYEGSQEIANPDYIAGQFIDNPDYIETKVILNPNYNYERGISYGGQALFEVPAFVVGTVFTGGALGAGIGVSRTTATIARGATLVDDIVRVAASSADDVARVAASGADDVVRVAASGADDAARVTAEGTAVAAQGADDGARVVATAAQGTDEGAAVASATSEGATITNAAATGAQSVDEAAALAAASGESVTISTRSAEMVHRAQLVKDALDANNRAFRATQAGEDLTTRATRGATKADEIVQGERAGTFLDGSRVTTPLVTSGARELGHADFIEYLAKYARTLRNKSDELAELTESGASASKIARAENAVNRAEDALMRELDRVNDLAGRNGLPRVTTDEALAATFQMTERVVEPGLVNAWNAIRGSAADGFSRGAERGFTWVGDFSRGPVNMIMEGGGAGFAYAMGYYGDKANAEATSNSGQAVAVEAVVEGISEERARMNSIFSGIAAEPGSGTTTEFNNSNNGLRTPLDSPVIQRELPSEAEAGLNAATAKY